MNTRLDTNLETNLTTNLANGGWIPASDTDEITCECESKCTYECPCKSIDCSDDDCGEPRGCLAPSEYGKKGVAGTCQCSGNGECD